MKEDVLILAIESSCDETAAAVVKNGREVLSNVISSQIALHTLYGGVVPEIASRKHIEKINQVVQSIGLLAQQQPRPGRQADAGGAQPDGRVQKADPGAGRRPCR